MGVAPYITPEGHARLKHELDRLWREVRPEVTWALAAAAAEGDRSENAEYIYRKKQLREIDRRIRHLGKRLDVLRVVREQPADGSRVWFGAQIEIVAADGTVRSFRIVGPDESDPARGTVSVDAPLARALLGRHAGDEVLVRLPEASQRWTIRTIAYP